jgi:hypothetical protein
MGAAILHVRRLAAAVIPDLALSDGEHLATVGLFLGGIGHDDAADGLLAFLETLNDETVVKRFDLHGIPLVVGTGRRSPAGRGVDGSERRDATERTRPAALWLFRTGHLLRRGPLRCSCRRATGNESLILARTVTFERDIVP